METAFVYSRSEQKSFVTQAAKAIERLQNLEKGNPNFGKKVE